MDNLLLYTLNKAQKGGGTPTPTTEPALRLIDWEGTVLKDYSLEEAMELTELPNPESLNNKVDREHLVFYGWNWTIAQMQAFLTKFPDYVLVVGAIYNTDQNYTNYYYHNGVEVSPDSEFIDTIKMSKSNQVSKTFIQQHSAELKHISIPNEMTTIDSKMFYECPELTSINLPASITRIEDYSFAHCSKLKSISLTAGVSYIGLRCFHTCASLEYFNGYLPNESGTPQDYTMGEYVFDGCISLKQAIIMMRNAGYTNIKGTFKNCVSLRKAPFRGATYSEEMFYGCVSRRNFVATSSGSFTYDVFLPDRCFANCINVQSMTFPDNSQLGCLGAEVFKNCYSLKEANLPYFVGGVYAAFPYIDNSGAFENCYSLRSVEMPGNYLELGNRIFKNCSSLTEITIPESVTSIGDYAFDGCSSLTEITIPESVTSIGDYAFSCSQQDVNIPSSITSVGKYAFQNCKGFADSTVLLPESLTYIGEKAFQGVATTGEILIVDANINSLPDVFTQANFSRVELGEQINYINSKSFQANNKSSIPSGERIWILKRSSMVYLSDTPSSNKYYIAPTKLYVQDELVSTYKSNSKWKTFAGTSPNTWVPRTLEGIVFPMSELPTE